MPPPIIKVCIKQLSVLIEAEKFTVKGEHMTTAVDHTLPMIHPECILEWVQALNLQISKEQFKTYAE